MNLTFLRHRGLRMALRIVLSVLFIYGSVVLAMFVLQKRFIYMPFRAIEAVPGGFGMTWEEVEIPLPEGGRLHGWWIPTATPAAGAVLYCHGNGGNISHCLEAAAAWHKDGLAVLLFDYRGYGQSDGYPGEGKMYADAQAAWDWLVREKRLAPRQILVHGFSMGGAVAAKVARDNGPAGLVLQSPVSSLADAAVRHYPWLPVRALLLYRYPAAEFVRTVRCPVAVLHSPTDEVVPYECGRKVFAAAPEPKTFIPLHSGHNDGAADLDPAVRAQLRALARTWLGPVPAK